MHLRGSRHFLVVTGMVAVTLSVMAMATHTGGGESAPGGEEDFSSTDEHVTELGDSISNDEEMLRLEAESERYLMGDAKRLREQARRDGAFDVPGP